MNLVLRGLSLNDNALSQPLVGRFDERGGSIGRSDNATMTLPDPERLISRVQANVTFSANVYWLEDVGSANPVVHNGLPLGPGVKVALKPNDDVRIGGYRLTVEYEQTDTTSTILRGRVQTGPRFTDTAPPRGAAVPTGNPFADLLGPGAAPAAPGRNDPFADLLSPAPVAHPPAALPSTAFDKPARGAKTPPPMAPNPARLPDDFDPFADLAPEPPAAPPPAASQADPLGLIDAQRGGTSSIDQAFGLDTPSGKDPLADFLARPAPAKAPRQPREPSLDPMAMFGAPADTPPTQIEPAAPDHAPPLSASFKPPPVVPAPKAKPAPRKSAAVPAARKPAPAAQPPATSTYTADEIWHGFLDGVGVDIPLPRGITPEMMRTIGVMLRTSVEGMLQLIAVRAATKNELRAEVTVIQVRDNNPLKFSPNANLALQQLLQPPGRGFLPGSEAIRDAMIDLQSHQIGTMAGMRAALAGVLERFKPELLEGRLTGQSMLDALLPMNRKAKLWELFLQHYRAIRNDAEEDFHQLFGKAFMEAYNAQVESLSQAWEQTSGPPR